jgi:hypothetical protein
VLQLFRRGRTVRFCRLEGESMLVFDERRGLPQLVSLGSESFDHTVQKVGVRSIDLLFWLGGEFDFDWRRSFRLDQLSLQGSNQLFELSNTDSRLCDLGLLRLNLVRAFTFGNLQLAPVALGGFEIILELEYFFLSVLSFRLGRPVGQTVLELGELLLETYIVCSAGLQRIGETLNLGSLLG